jgi:hypothetical protein
MRAVCVVLLAGCGFQASSSGTPVDSNNPVIIDASADQGGGGDATPPIDARVCFGAGLVKVCLMAPPSKPVNYAGASNTIDTSNANNCTRLVPQTGGPELCVIAGTTVSVGGTVTVTGTRALVLLAAETLSVTGTLDGSSTTNTNPRRTGPGANLGACNPAGTPDNSTGGGGGGGGGSLATKGGNGGAGDQNPSGRPNDAKGGTAGNAQGAPAVLRGGCPGGKGGDADAQHRGGDGGAGGGAIYLIAGLSITVSGDVFASGAGGGASNNAAGAEQGGGGGGTGGMIGLDAPAIDITATARVVANGGGGGGGGGLNTGGTPGGDGTTTNWNTRAAAGTPGAGGSGTSAGGAPGTAINLTDNINGPDGDGGAGGAGGGMGIVSYKGAMTAGTQVSPAATAQP